MKHVFNRINIFGAIALVALTVGCTTTTQTQNKENLLIAAGFKVIIPKTAAQQQKLQTLPAGRVSLVQKDGRTCYVFPDAPNNQAYVGGPQQYQTYKQLRLANQLSNENLEAAEIRQENEMNLGAWAAGAAGGWSGICRSEVAGCQNRADLPNGYGFSRRSKVARLSRFRLDLGPIAMLAAGWYGSVRLRAGARLVHYTPERAPLPEVPRRRMTTALFPMKTYLLIVGVAISLALCTEGQMPPAAAYNFNRVIVRKVQIALRNRGYYHDLEDGYLGYATGNAIQLYQISHHIRVIPLLDPSLLISLGIAR